MSGDNAASLLDESSDFERLIDDLTRLRTCTACNRGFTDRTAYGHLECRRHRGVLQPVMAAYGTEIDTFSCCGVSPYPRHARYKNASAASGCWIVDHTDQPRWPEDVTMSLERARVLFGDDIATRNVRVHADEDDLITIYRSRNQ